MDQIITLLSNLFNLTKVASVTLPGIALAGALVLFLHPPNPIDTVRIPILTEFKDDLQPIQEPCADLKVGVKGGKVVGNCGTGKVPTETQTPSCQLVSVTLNIFNDSNEFEESYISSKRPYKTTAGWPWDGESGTLALVNLFRSASKQKADISNIDTSDVDHSATEIKRIATVETEHPWQAKIIKQYVLETTRDRLTQCADRETAAQGQESADNDQLKTDIANLDKQRSDIQDAYIASLKANDRAISGNLQFKLTSILELSNEYRARFRVNLISLNERARRLSDIAEEKENITARLVEPGRLRPIKEFDLYIQGLVNHVVGLVLLSIALSLILVAFDRTVLGNLFESLFGGW
jgi:hypothetical protein